MSAIMTSIRIGPIGIQDWGRKEPGEMIRQIRAYAAHLREQVEAVEAATDTDFTIRIVRGPHVQHHVATLQEGLATPSKAPDHAG